MDIFKDLCYGRGWADDLTIQPTKIADAIGVCVFVRVCVACVLSIRFVAHHDSNFSVVSDGPHDAQLQTKICNDAMVLVCLGCARRGGCGVARGGRTGLGGARLLKGHLYTASRLSSAAPPTSWSEIQVLCGDSRFVTVV